MLSPRQQPAGDNPGTACQQLVINSLFRAGYNDFMGARLSAVNRYLRNPVARERAVVKSVATSSAIEGIRAPFKRKPGGVYAISGRVRKKA